MGPHRDRPLTRGAVSDRGGGRPHRAVGCGHGGCQEADGGRWRGSELRTTALTAAGTCSKTSQLKRLQLQCTIAVHSTRFPLRYHNKLTKLLRTAQQQGGKRGTPSHVLRTQVQCKTCEQRFTDVVVVPFRDRTNKRQGSKDSSQVSTVCVQTSAHVCGKNSVNAHSHKGVSATHLYVRLDSLCGTCFETVRVKRGSRHCA